MSATTASVVEELRDAAQEWIDGKSVAFDTDVRLVDAINAAIERLIALQDD